MRIGWAGTRALYRGYAAQDFAAEPWMLDERFAQLRRSLDPVHATGEHDTTGANGVDRWVVGARRRGAPLAQGRCRLDQSAAGADDHRVASAQVLFPALVDRTHAFGDRLVLQIDARDAGVAG